MNKIIVISCMHGRNKTVEYCLNKMPFIDKIMIYSTDEDGQFLDGQDVIGTAQVKNRPLSYKWGQAFFALEQIDFDGVVILGSDDYIDEKFLKFAQDNISDYDMIGFEDAYFKHNEDFYYWAGYDNQRKGEPAGAGKIYSKKFLERIKYDLYPLNKNVGLDGMANKVCKDNNAKMMITTLKEQDLFMCDVKDGEGMNSFEKLNKFYNFEKI